MNKLFAFLIAVVTASGFCFGQYVKRTIEPVPSPDSAEVLEYICSYSNDSMELYECRNGRSMPDV